VVRAYHHCRICTTHPKLSAALCWFRDAKAAIVKPADAVTPLQSPTSQEGIDRRRDVGRRRSPAVPPQVVDSRARTPTLPDDESTGELEPSDAEPRLHSQSPRSAASSREVDPQQRSGSCCLSQDRDQRGDSVQTSDLEHRHPLVPDNGEE
jgi:hypothetical protein